MNKIKIDTLKRIAQNNYNYLISKESLFKDVDSLIYLCCDLSLKDIDILDLYKDNYNDIITYIVINNIELNINFKDLKKSIKYIIDKILTDDLLEYHKYSNNNKIDFDQMFGD